MGVRGRLATLDGSSCSLCVFVALGVFGILGVLGFGARRFLDIAVDRLESPMYTEYKNERLEEMWRREEPTLECPQFIRPRNSIIIRRVEARARRNAQAVGMSRGAASYPD